MKNVIYSQMIPNEQKLCLKGIAHVLMSSTQILFKIFNEKLIFFEILLNVGSPIA